MPFGSSEAGSEPIGGRYGAPGLLAAVLTMLLLEFLTAVFMLSWYLVPVTVLPAVVVTALVAYGLTRAGGVVAQVGRGMLMGCTSVPLTLVILIPAYLAGRAAGLV